MTLLDAENVGIVKRFSKRFEELTKQKVWNDCQLLHSDDHYRCTDLCYLECPLIWCARCWKYIP